MGVDSPMSHRSNKTMAFALILFFTIILGINVNASITTNLISYYAFEDTNVGTGATIDSNILGENLNSTNNDVNQSGIISYSNGFRAATSRTISPTSTRYGDLTKANANFSISAWFKKSGENSVTRYLIDKYDTGANNGFYLAFPQEYGKIEFYQRAVGGEYRKYRTTSDFNDGAWHFIEVVSTASSITIYIDDINQPIVLTSSGGVYSNCDNGESLIIGNLFSGGYANNFDGNIDEVGLWAKDLNAEERNILWNSGLGNTYPFTTPLVIKYTLIFNVRDANTATHLNNVTVDCNVNAYDSTGNVSPFSEEIAEGSYSCIFSKTGYDSNTISFISDSNKTINVYLKDNNSPSTTISGCTSGWHTTNKTITLNCIDLGSGCLAKRYSLNSAAWVNYVNPFIVTDGNNKIDYNSIDYAGNVESTKTSYCAVDTTAPASSIAVYYNGVINSRDLNITCVDAVSGCKKNYWTINGGATQSSTSNPAGFVQSGIGGYTIQYWSENNADLNSVTQSYTLNISGTATIRVRDENSMGDLNSVSLTSYDGNTYTINTLLNVDLNNASATSQQYTFSFSKAGYGSRTYSLDMNRFSSFDLNILLLPTSLTNNIKYKFYAPDETTILSNQYVELKHWLKDGNTCGRIKTNALGEATFNMNMRDANYHFYINNGTYDYNSFVLSVLKPRDEADGTIIDANWNILASGVGASVDTNISATSKALYVYPNTVATYILTISSENLDPVYLSRKYEVSYVGNPSSASLQPYLITSDSGTAIKLITQQDNGLTITAYPSINIKIYKNLPAGRTLVEETVTDTKGEALVTLVAADTYEFELYDSNNAALIFNDSNISTIKVTGTEIYFVISVLSQTYSIQSAYGLALHYNPVSQSILYKTVGSQTFYVDLNNLGDTNINVVSYVIQNGVVKDTEDFNGTADHVFGHSVLWTNLVKGKVSVYVVVDTLDGNHFVYKQDYTIHSGWGGKYDIFTLISSGLRTDLGCSATGICAPLLALALIICAGLVVFVSIKMSMVGTQSASILFGIGLSLFTYLTWVPLELTIVVWVLIVAFIITDKRGSQ
ncbi:MAG: LamG domain-containing protein [Magnetococcus sp. YQC-3]